MKHTAKTLGKYIDMYAWSEYGALSTGQFKIEVLDSHRYGGGVVFYVEGEVARAFSSQVYPILKTLDDLTDAEFDELFPRYQRHEIAPDFSVKCIQCSPLNILPRGELTLALGMKLLSEGIGAIPYENSPTGFVSLFDGLPDEGIGAGPDFEGLPCKSWGEVFK